MSREVKEDNLKFSDLIIRQFLMPLAQAAKEIISEEKAQPPEVLKYGIYEFSLKPEDQYEGKYEKDLKNIFTKAFPNNSQVAFKELQALFPKSIKLRIFSKPALPVYYENEGMERLSYINIAAQNYIKRHMSENKSEAKLNSEAGRTLKHIEAAYLKANEELTKLYENSLTSPAHHKIHFDGLTKQIDTFYLRVISLLLMFRYPDKIPSQAEMFAVAEDLCFYEQRPALQSNQELPSKFSAFDLYLGEQSDSIRFRFIQRFYANLNFNSVYAGKFNPQTGEIVGVNTHYYDVPIAADISGFFPDCEWMLQELRAQKMMAILLGFNASGQYPQMAPATIQEFSMQWSFAVTQQLRPLLLQGPINSFEKVKINVNSIAIKKAAEIAAIPGRVRNLLALRAVSLIGAKNFHTESLVDPIAQHPSCRLAQYAFDYNEQEFGFAYLHGEDQKSQQPMIKLETFFTCYAALPENKTLSTLEAKIQKLDSVKNYRTKRQELANAVKECLRSNSPLIRGEQYSRCSEIEKNLFLIINQAHVDMQGLIRSSTVDSPDIVNQILYFIFNLKDEKLLPALIHLLMSLLSSKISFALSASGRIYPEEKLQEKVKQNCGKNKSVSVDDLTMLEIKLSNIVGNFAEPMKESQTGALTQFAPLRRCDDFKKSILEDKTGKKFYAALAGGNVDYSFWLELKPSAALDEIGRIFYASQIRYLPQEREELLKTLGEQIVKYRQTIGVSQIDFDALEWLTGCIKRQQLLLKMDQEIEDAITKFLKTCQNKFSDELPHTNIAIILSQIEDGSVDFVQIFAQLTNQVFKENYCVKSNASVLMPHIKTDGEKRLKIALQQMSAVNFKSKDDFISSIMSARAAIKNFVQQIDDNDGFSRSASVGLSSPPPRPLSPQR